MLTLPTFTFPSYSLASSSTIGPIILQGPHHSAQKSTSTGVSDLSTSCSKLASVKVTIFAADIQLQCVWGSNARRNHRLLQHQDPDQDHHSNQRRGYGKGFVHAADARHHGR